MRQVLASVPAVAFYGMKVCASGPENFEKDSLEPKPQDARSLRKATLRRMPGHSISKHLVERCEASNLGQSVGPTLLESILWNVIPPARLQLDWNLPLLTT